MRLKMDQILSKWSDNWPNYYKTKEVDPGDAQQAEPLPLKEALQEEEVIHLFVPHSNQTEQVPPKMTALNS